MKLKNAKAGLQVVVKDVANSRAKAYIGCVGKLIGDDVIGWAVEFKSGAVVPVYLFEVRKLRDGDLK